MMIARLQPVPDILTARHIQDVADAIRHLIPDSELTGQYVTGISMKEAYTRTILANSLEEYKEPWSGYEPSLEDGMRKLEDLYRPEAERDPEDKSLGPQTGFFGVSRAMIGGRQLMHTNDGYLGIAPPLERGCCLHPHRLSHAHGAPASGEESVPHCRRVLYAWNL